MLDSHGYRHSGTTDINFNFNFGFSWFYFSEISLLFILWFLLRILIQIHWFLVPWIVLWVFFPNISKSLISIHVSSSDLIKFQKIPWNYLNYLWIPPLFTIILFNSWLFDKIGEFGNSFDTNWCVINDRINSSRQWWCHQNIGEYFSLIIMPKSLTIIVMMLILQWTNQNQETYIQSARVQMIGHLVMKNQSWLSSGKLIFPNNLFSKNNEIGSKKVK